MNRIPMIVANWKMNMPLFDAMQFASEHFNGLNALAQQCTLLICPSFVALYPIAQLFDGKTIKLGAQDCAPYAKGAYTGEVDALSLKQLGCQYTIVGHAERRRHFHESNEIIEQKITHLVEQQITPIVCIGEQEKIDLNSACTALREQLQVLKKTYMQSQQPVVIAYEPAWAIGTGVVPPITYLTALYHEIKQILATEFPKLSYTLLYGGSLDEKNIPVIASTGMIDGFMIGGASLDFQKLQNIVSLAMKSGIHDPHGAKKTY